MKMLSHHRLSILRAIPGAVALWLVMSIMHPCLTEAASPPVGTSIVNNAIVQFKDANGNESPSVKATVSTAIAGAPVLKIAKESGSDPIAPGALLTYTLTYENTGNIQATSVSLIDTLPSEVEFRSASNGGSQSGRTVTWDLGTLVSGTKGTVQVVVQVKDTVSSTVSIKNTARITSTEGAADETIIYTSIGNGSDLLISKTASPDTVMPGGIITYVIRYLNKGNQTAQQVGIRDELPLGTAFVADSITDNGVLAERTVTWNLGSLDPGAEGQVSFQVKTTTLAKNGDSFRNQATIISQDQLNLSNEVTTSVADQLPLFVVKTDSPDPVIVGNPIIYAIEATNITTISLTGLVITDSLPLNTDFVSADNGGQLTDGQVSWNLGSLAAGTTRAVHLTLEVTGLPPGNPIITNTVTAKADNSISQSASSVTSVLCRTKPEIIFLDSAGNQVNHYPAGANICVRITDLDRNTDSNAAETISVVIRDLSTNDSETLILNEINPADGLSAKDTGVFSASIKTNTSALQANDGELTVSQDTEISVTYDDPNDVLCGYPVETKASVFIDPLGMVFDSVTGKSVSGVIVTLIDDSTGRPAALPQPPLVPNAQANPVTTGADGRFRFEYVNAGTYHLQVIPISDYAFPSTIPNSELAAGFIIVPGSRGESFSLTGGMSPLNLDIPVDPPQGSLYITKDINKKTAAIGDILRYTVTIANNGKAPVSSFIIRDIMPHGIEYLKGSTRVNGDKMPDPAVGEGRSLTWSAGKIEPGTSVELVYRASIGPDANQGDGKNTASASGISLGRAVSSNTASVTVTITEGVFTSRATIIGKVFIDADADGLQDEAPSEEGEAVEKEETPAGEAGVQGVVIYLEDGTRVITDKNGKFSIPGVRQGTHVLRVDETSLPKGVILIPTNNRFMGSGNSQFIDVPLGGLFKANFAVQKAGEEKVNRKNLPAPELRKEEIQNQPVSPAARTPLVKGGEDTSHQMTVSQPASGKETAGELTLEEKIKDMTQALQFLSPSDGAVSSMSRIKVQVKAASDLLLTLSINETPVSEKQIGRKIVYEAGGVAIYEFIDVELLPGKVNIIKAEIRDPFGNLRGSEQISVTVPGPAERIIVKPAGSEAPADGISSIPVNITVVDREGRPIQYPSTITVDISTGEIVEKDSNPDSSGHQIPYENGHARFTVLAPRETGKMKIDVRCEGLEETAEVYFTPYLRDLFISGIGEVTIGHGGTSGDTGYLKDGTDFDEGTYTGLKGAFFMKGNIFKDYLLTAAFDSDKKKTDDLFRESETNLDTEDKYPIYGDESKVGYEAMSADRLYVKLEKGKSSLLYGDYRTELTDTKISAYNRSFNGLKLGVQTDKFKLRSFGAYTNQTQVVDSLSAKGISGYYYLSNQSIMEGSERVVIEVRDRMQIDRVISRDVKSRGSDYEIDYDLGTVLFKSPVAGSDANLNPVYIIVTYESRQAGGKYFIYGGRGAYRLADWLELGGTAITEEKAAGDYELFGMDATIKLPLNTTLKAETAYTDSMFDTDSALVKKSGNGLLSEFESKPGDKVVISGFYRSLDNYFYNPSAADMMRGTTRYGIDLLYEIIPDLTLKAKHLDEKDELNSMTHRFSSLGLQKTMGKTILDMDLSRETANDRYMPQTSPTNRIPFDNSFETPDELNSVKIGVESKVWEKITLSASHKQNIGGDSFYNTQAGLKYDWNEQTRVYVREERQKYQDGTQMQTVLGVESQVFKNTDAYNEYRLSNGADGARNQQVIGLKTRMKITDATTGNISAEYLSTLSGKKRPGEPDALALATGLEYLPKDAIKMTGRLEYRHEIGANSRDSYLAELNSAYKINPDYSLLFKERFSSERLSGSGNHDTSRTMMGLAYRPIDNDSFNALTRLEYKHDRNDTLNPATLEDAYILSLEGVKQFTGKLQLIGRYAGKFAQESDYRAYTDLLSGRILYDLTERIDMGAEYRLFSNHRTGTILHGGAVEAGYRIVKNLWVSAGYSFDRFDSDLIGDNYRGCGPYLTLRLKFDETSFKRSAK